MNQVSIEELAKYADQYIALSKDHTKIFTAAKTIKDLNMKIREMKIKDSVLHYVRPLDGALSLLCQS